MIKTFQNFNSLIPLKESHKDIDPYNEEDWGDGMFNKGDVMIAKRDKINFDGKSEFKGGSTYIIGSVVPTGIGNYCIFKDLKGNYITFMRDVDIPDYFRKVNESHSEIDPYNEENWDEDEDDKVFKVGDKVVCIYDSTFLKTGQEYEIESIGFYHFLKLKGVDRYWDSIRFVKKSLNESHSEIDPYEEENWDDDEFKVGDKVICTINSVPLKKGREYEIKDIKKSGVFIFFKLKNVDLIWLADRFIKKPLNENHSEIDLDYIKSDTDTEIIYLKDLRERHSRVIQEGSRFNFVQYKLIPSERHIMYDLESIVKELQQKINSSRGFRVEKKVNGKWKKLNRKSELDIEADFYQLWRLDIHENRILMYYEIPQRGMGGSFQGLDVAMRHEYEYRNCRNTDSMRIVFRKGKSSITDEDPYGEEWWDD